MGILTTWIILASYIKMFALVVIIIIIIAQFVLLRYYFGLNAKERRYDALIDGVPDGEWESESQTLFWTSIFTSWISPTTVWSNNIINKCNIEELTKKYDLANPSIMDFGEDLCQRTKPKNKIEDQNIFKENSNKYKRKSKILIASSLVNNVILASSFFIIILLVWSNYLTFPVPANPPVFYCNSYHQNLAPGLTKMSHLPM